MLIMIALGLVFAVIFAFIRIFSGDFGPGLATLCLAPIAAIFYVIIARVWSEFIIVVFRIAENTTEMVEQNRKGE